MNNTPTRYQCISVNQPLGTFYVCSIPAAKILPLVSIERRGLTPEEQQNVQRGLDPKRQVDIAKYVHESDATFPTSVTLSANSDFVHIVEDPNKTLCLVIGTELEPRNVAANNLPDDTQQGILEIIEENVVRRFSKVPDGEKVALVIDGQHRIEGLRAAGAYQEGSPLGDFEVPLVFMFDLSPELMARIFVTINSNQRRVDPSLISDLFGLSSRRSPMRTCHLIAAILNSEKDGPFSGGLKMLGRRQKTAELPKTTELLSQGSFCKYLLKLISNNSEEDERRLQRGEEPQHDSRYPLREFFISERDDIIIRIIKNYFSVVKRTYSAAWEKEPEKYLLRKTVGFASLTKLFLRILPVALEVDCADQPAFERVFLVIKEAFPESEWAVGKFSSSEADASRIANRLYESIKEKLPKLLIGDPETTEQHKS